MAVDMYRAFRFVHPDLDSAAQPVGLNISPTGGIEMVADRESVRQAILLLLSTVRGERVMRPTYGCDLHKLAFMPNDTTTHGMAIHYVRQALERWERRIDILRIDAHASDERAELLEIVLDYRVRRTLITDQLTIHFNLAQG
jgi:phage baseplate assembly protein W